MKQDLSVLGEINKSPILKNPIVPYQFYRIGGRSYYKMSDSSNIGPNLSLQLVLKANQRADLVHDEKITCVLSGTSDNWFDFSSTVQLLKTGISNNSLSSIDLIQNITGSISSHVLELYLDEIWAEFDGGLQFGAQDGCLDFARYYAWPTEGSFSFKQIITDSTFSPDLKRSLISFEIENSRQDFYDQLLRLLEWQERGYLLNLHSYINDVPNTLTGRLKLSNIKKPHWDLSLRDLSIEFEEVLI
jgi:hypothetical protein